MLIIVDDIAGVFPRPLEDDEQLRAERLISAADDLIREEFLRRGRDLDTALTMVPWLPLTYKRVVREMISEAIHIGDNVGRQSASSNTGPQADSVTWSQGVGIHWGGVYLTDQWRRDLGLLQDSTTMGQYPPPMRYEGDRARSRRRGAEFSERRWSR